MKSRPVLSFGTLPTTLAKAQTQAVIDALLEVHPRLTCQMTITPSPLTAAQRGSEPYLAAAAAEVEHLEGQLLAGEFRYVVQRAGDLVLPLPEGVVYAAIPPRDNPFDAFLNRQGLIADEMPGQAEIGVLNLRAKAQTRHLWPHLKSRVLTGGIEGALEVFLRRCDVDGLVMPAAVGEHLGIQGIVSEIFYPEMVLPSSGQGILVVLARQDDPEAIELLAGIHSVATSQELEAEHAFMQRFASDQDLPVSVLAQVTRDKITVTGAIGSLHGSEYRDSLEGPASQAAEIGANLAQKLLMSGEAVIGLLEADFPEGLPPLDLDDPLTLPLDDDLPVELTDLEIPED